MIEIANLDSRYIAGSRCIDSITVSYDLMEFVDRSKLYETNKIMNTDHRSYVIDLNIE